MSSIRLEKLTKAKENLQQYIKLINVIRKLYQSMEAVGFKCLTTGLIKIHDQIILSLP